MSLIFTSLACIVFITVLALWSFLCCDQKVEMRKKQQGEVIAQLSNALAKAQSALEVWSLFLIDVDFD